MAMDNLSLERLRPAAQAARSAVDAYKQAAVEHCDGEGTKLTAVSSRGQMGFRLLSLLSEVEVLLQAARGGDRA
tara:strand:- start:5478 stop:5699 length:222 start_codon:yes stop_codon:yes gene_type:complete